MTSSTADAGADGFDRGGCTVMAAGTLATGMSARAQDDDLARELPRIKPLDPPAALESFRIHAGFRARASGRRAAGHRPGQRLL